MARRCMIRESLHLITLAPRLQAQLLIPSSASLVRQNTLRLGLSYLNLMDRIHRAICQRLKGLCLGKSICYLELLSG